MNHSTAAAHPQSCIPSSTGCLLLGTCSHFNTVLTGQPTPKQDQLLKHIHTWTKVQRCTKHFFKESRIKRHNQTLVELVLWPSCPTASQEANFRAQLSTKQSHYGVLQSPNFNKTKQLSGLAWHKQDPVLRIISATTHSSLNNSHQRSWHSSSQQLAYQFNCIFLQCKQNWSKKGLDALGFKYIHILILHFVKGQREERGFVLQECCTSFSCYCFKLLPHKSLASYSKCRKLVTSAETLQRHFDPQHGKWNREIASARLLSCTKAELNTYSQTFNFWLQ